MRPLLHLLWLACALGCSPARAAPWVPSLVIRASGRASSRPDARGDAWRVEGALRWRSGRARPIDEPLRDPKPPGPIEAGPSCLDAALCAWERRARARALARRRR